MAKLGEFGRGWPVLSAAAVGVGLGLSPLPFYTIGVFIPPLLGEFGPKGWDGGFIMNALAIYTFGACASAPIVGILAERFGARRIALISIVTFSLAMMAIGLNTGSKPLYIFLWMVLAFSGAGTLPITFTRPVANWFETNRGIALGIALIATGVFGAMAKFFAQYITSHFDWRTAYFALGLLPLMIALPLSFLALRDVGDVPARDAKATRMKLPILGVSVAATLAFIALVLSEVTGLIEKNGIRLVYHMPFIYSLIILVPVGLMVFFKIGTEPPAIKSRSAQGAALAGMTLTQALADWRFWLLAIVFIPISYAVGAIIPNIENVLRASNFDQDTAVGLATLTGLAVLGGRVIGGYLIDRLWAPGVAFAFLASPAIALWMLGQPDIDANTATFAILLVGFGAGVEYDFMAYMVSRYFGMKSYSAIYGAIYAFFALGAGLGPGIMVNLATGKGLKIIEWDLGVLVGHDWKFTLASAAIILFISTVPLLFLGKYRFGHEHDGALVNPEEASEATEA